MLGFQLCLKISNIAPINHAEQGHPGASANLQDHKQRFKKPMHIAYTCLHHLRTWQNLSFGPLNHFAFDLHLASILLQFLLVMAHEHQQSGWLAKVTCPNRMSCNCHGGRQQG